MRSVRDLGVVVRERRMARGLSQSALAAQVGVSREWVNSVERGKPNVQLAPVFDLLTVLDLQLALVERTPHAEADALMDELYDGGFT